MSTAGDDDHAHPAASGLYARLGGSPVLEAVVEIFYDLNLKAWPPQNCQLVSFCC
jgi:hypothetical protein